MKIVNQHDVETEERKSPHGKYHLHRKFLSLALGGKSDAGPWAGGHPFDLELTRVPPGATNFPLHQHSAQWELYIILEGEGEVNDGRELRRVKPGDVFLAEPEQPHNMKNVGATDLLYYVIATNQWADVTFYNETGTWGIKPQKTHFEMREVPYYQPTD